VAGTLPPIAFLLWSQWVMYGNPFTPGQVWMPIQNEYVEVERADGRFQIPSSST
jgi:hypothetical protein